MIRILTSPRALCGVLLLSVAIGPSAAAQFDDTKVHLFISSEVGFLTTGDDVTSGIRGTFSRKLTDRFSIVARGEFAMVRRGEDLRSISTLEWRRRNHFLGDLMGQFDLMSYESRDLRFVASIRAGISGMRGRDRAVDTVYGGYLVAEACEDSSFTCGYLDFDDGSVEKIAYKLNERTVNGRGWASSLLLSQRFFNSYLMSFELGLRNFKGDLMWTAGFGVGYGF